MRDVFYKIKKHNPDELSALLVTDVTFSLNCDKLLESEPSEYVYTSITSPVTISWTEAFRDLSRYGGYPGWYTRVAMKKKLFYKIKPEIWERAEKRKDSIDIFKLRMDIVQFVRSIGQPRDIWKKEEYIETILALIVQTALKQGGLEETFEFK